MDHNEGRRPRSTNDADATSRPSHPGTAGGEVPAVAALVQPWLRLSVQLTPLIGESGFCALFGRALRLSSVRFEGLATCDSARPLADLFTSLTRTLNEIGPEYAEAANGALLGTFTTLLGNLIGEALTKQLLQVASAGADEQKHGQEQK
ncbi:hypothetical protein [Massilia sp. GCM10023247]|uniref:hypothetical protein n=1 Tax=Massilia sp. GCM10023247 TaxID=3252643 RepID=UPI0036228BB9